MLCPKCNKEMKAIYQPRPIQLPDDSKYVEVLGRCEDCDFDAYWEIVTYADGHTKESNLRPYFFG